jgi:hypothetical protein
MVQATAAAEEAAKEGAGPDAAEPAAAAEGAAIPVLEDDDAFDGELDNGGRGTLLETDRDRLIRLVCSPGFSQSARVVSPLLCRMLLMGAWGFPEVWLSLSCAITARWAIHALGCC